MTTRLRAPLRGTARRRAPRSRPLAAVLALTLVTTVAALIPGATPAGADTVTTTALLDLTCTADTPIGAQVVNQALNIDIDHPDRIARNTVEEVVISQPALPVPTEISGYPLNRLSGLAVTIKVPPQFRIDSAEVVHLPLEAGNLKAEATVNHLASGEATLTIPGPLLGGNSYQLPELHIGLRAVGTPGTSGGFLFQSFNLAANATLPVFGARDLPVSCPTPSPNPPMFSIEVGPGAFSTAPDPVIATGTIVQPTVSKYGSSQVPSGANRTNNDFSIIAEHLPNAAPGSVLDVVITPPSKDWTAPYRVDPHTVQTRQMSKVRNLRLELGGPNTSVFEVVSVTSANPAQLAASYDAATNRIVLTTPTNTAYASGSALGLPAVTLKVRALGDGSTYEVGRLTFEKVSFQMAYQTQTCIIICFGWGSDKWMNATTQGANPGASPVGTQPNDTLYFPNVANGQVITSFGVANEPGAHDDHVTVANNASVDVDVLANDVAGTFPLDASTLVVVDAPSHGDVDVNPVSGVVRYTPTYGTLEKLDGFTYAVKDTSGRYTNVASVTIDIVGLYCEGPCALDQIITVDVNPDVLTLAQDGGQSVLESITLNGEAQWATGSLSPLTVTNRRGSAASWSLTGQLESDFRDSDSAPACPVGDPASWNHRCIPGDNLGWEPLATVGHEVVPGDVADVAAGPASTSGLRSAAQSLCTAPEAQAGGTFTCGAVLSLGVPASAAAQGYSATITLTLA